VEVTHPLEVTLPLQEDSAEVVMRQDTLHPSPQPAVTTLEIASEVPDSQSEGRDHCVSIATAETSAFSP
jgi:hypothetical protein